MPHNIHLITDFYVSNLEARMPQAVVAIDRRNNMFDFDGEFNSVVEVGDIVYCRNNYGERFPVGIVTGGTEQTLEISLQLSGNEMLWASDYHNLLSNIHSKTSKAVRIPLLKEGR